MRLAVGMHKESGLRHEKLQQYLKAGLAEPVRRLGENLAGLCGFRNDADYNMSARFDAGDAKQCIDDPQAFLAALAAVNPQEVGKALDTNIRKTHTHP
jgi:hypothetical protein